MADLEEQYAEVGSQQAHKRGFERVRCDAETVEAVRRTLISLLDDENPENLKLLLRSYIERLKISDDSVGVHFAFRESPDSSQPLVAGVGFEPTTFGL